MCTQFSSGMIYQSSKMFMYHCLFIKEQEFTHPRAFLSFVLQRCYCGHAHVLQSICLCQPFTMHSCTQNNFGPFESRQLPIDTLAILTHTHTANFDWWLTRINNSSHRSLKHLNWVHTDNNSYRYHD